MQFATRAAARVQEGTIGARAEEVAALHPPTITLSLTLGNVSLPGGPLAPRQKCKGQSVLLAS